MADTKKSSIAITSSTNMSDVAKQISNDVTKINKDLDNISFAKAKQRAIDFQNQLKHINQLQKAFSALGPLPGSKTSTLQNDKFVPQSGRLQQTQSDLGAKIAASQKAAQDALDRTKKAQQAVADTFKRTNKEIIDSVKTVAREIGKIGTAAKNALSKIGSLGKAAFDKLKSIALKAIAAITAAFYALQKVFTAGFEFNMKLEGAQNGIAGLIASTYELRDAQNQVVSGQEKFTVATAESQKQVQKLMVASRSGAANFDEMLDTYQQTIGPASNANMTPDQAREFAVLIANTAKGMGMAQGMSGQESRALISGKIDKNATIGMALGLGPGGSNQKEYKEALKTGKVFEYLTEKLEYMKLAAEKSATSMSTVFSTIKMNFQELASKTVNELSMSFRKLSDYTSSFFDKDNNITEYWQPLLSLFDVIGGVIGDKVVSVFAYMAESGREIGEYFKKNPESFELLLNTASSVWELFKEILKTVFDLGVTVYKVVTNFFGIDKAINSSTEGLDDFQKVVLTIQNALTIVKGIVQGVGELLKGIVLTVSAMLKRAIDGIRSVAAAALSTLTSMANGLIEAIGMAVSMIPGLGDTGEKIQRAANKMNDDAASAAIDVAGEDNYYTGVKKSQLGGGKSFIELSNSKESQDRVAAMKAQNDKDFEDIGKNFANNIKKIIEDSSQELKDNGEKLRKAVEERKLREAQRAKDAKDPNYDPLKNNTDANAPNGETLFERAERRRLLAKAKNDQLIAAAAKANFKANPANADGDDKTKNKNLMEAYKNQMKLIDINAKSIRDRFSMDEKFIQQKYENNKIYIGDYYKKIDKMSEDSYKHELDVSLAKSEVVKKELEKIGNDPKRQKDINTLKREEVKISLERNNLEQEYSLKMETSMIKRKQALMEYSREIQDLQIKTSEFKFGDRGLSTKISTDREDEDLRNKYQNDPAGLSAASDYIAQKRKQDNYDSIMKEYNLSNETRGIAEERIGILVQNNRLSEIDSLAQIRDLRKGSIKDLEAYVESLEQMNKESQNPALKNQIEQTRNQILQLKMELDPLAKKFDDLFYNGLTQAMTDFMDGTKSAKDAFKDFSSSITKELLNLVNNKMVTQLFDMMFKATDDNGKTTGGNSMIGGLFSGLFSGKRATGGSAAPNMPILVGEKGPEIFTPRSSGFVTANHNVNGRNNNGSTIIQNINVVTRDAASFNYSGSQVAQTTSRYINRGLKNN